MIRRFAASAAALACVLMAAAVPAVDRAAGELAAYVARPDPSFSWRKVGEGRVGSTEYAELILTSQTWRGIPWKHQLFLFRPARRQNAARQGFLFVHGGRWREEFDQGLTGELPREARIFARLAETVGAPLGVLRQVPRQPLFDRREDALIAYTFDHYLRTGEPDWPLLLPMVKSASRAMDAMQRFVREEWGIEIDAFTISGASKRGWTSWLTAAVDPRVRSVAPMVIDMLNVPAQIELQRATFGGLSEQVQDYQEIGLAARVDTAEGRRLLEIVDPYSYRRSLTQPKLILLGTNDRYWPVDALNVYWNDLPDPKHVLYVPNQGHGLRDVNRLIASLAALHRHSANGTSLPRLSWHFEREPDSLSLEVGAEPRPRRVRAWSATSPTPDFREARWRSHRCERRGDRYVCRRPVEAGEYTAMYAELWFREPGAPDYPLSTTLCVAGDPGHGRPGC